MAEKNQTRSWLVVVLALVILLPAGWFIVMRMEGSAPEIVIQPELTFLGEAQTVKVSVRDLRSGLKKVKVDLKSDGKTALLYAKTFRSQGFGQAGEMQDTSFELNIHPKTLGISDGNAVLQVTAQDYAWRNWWRGNEAVVEKQLMVDTQPPEINVLTRNHYINQGGTGLVIYKMSEACPSSGVKVGDAFFPGRPGYFKGADIFLAFFAVAYDQSPDTKIAMQATDAAGNQAHAGFYYNIRKKVLV